MSDGPVARVVVDVRHVSVDRTFDYRIDSELRDQVQFGVRVRVRFAGRLVTGLVVDVVSASDHPGELQSVKSVHGPPVLTPETLALARLVAARSAGTLSEILRDTVPPRRARVEKAFAAAAPIGPVREHSEVAAGPNADWPNLSWPHPDWTGYTGFGAEVGNLPRADVAAWRVSAVAATSEDRSDFLTRLVQSAWQARYRDVAIIVPTVGDLNGLGRQLSTQLNTDLIRLTAADGPDRRYRNYLEALRPDRDQRCLIGTRHAVLAPLASPELVVVWDDGADDHWELRSPGWNSRDVALLRSLHLGHGVVLAGYCRSVEAARLVDSGWMQSLTPTRQTRRNGAKIRTLADEVPSEQAIRARVSHQAFAAIRQGLARGPVLVSVPRSGASTVLFCRECGQIGVCPECGEPLVVPSDRRSPPRCPVRAHSNLPSGPTASAPSAPSQRPASSQAGPICTDCGGRRWRPGALGADTMAADLGRSFPGVEVLISTAAVGIVRSIDDQPRIVVATPGAEPEPPARYCASVIADVLSWFDRTDLRSSERAIRHFMDIVAMTRRADDGGVCVILAEPDSVIMQAIVRGDSAGWAAREWVERQHAGLPPARRAVRISGPFRTIAEFAQRPVVAIDESWSVVLSADHAQDLASCVVLAPIAAGARLSEWALKVRHHFADSAHNRTGPIEVRVDPLSLD